MMVRHSRIGHGASAAVVALMLMSPAAAEMAGVPREVYWGDTHLHTSNSADAYAVGNEELGPDDAFRFAKGAEMTMHNGMKAKLTRPLDFLVVSDHSEYLGIYGRLSGSDPAIGHWELGRRWSDYMKSGQRKQLTSEFLAAIQSTDDKFKAPQGLRQSIWSEVVRTADRHNDPGRFTAFTGYEWTSMPDGNNLHRVVIYRDGGDTAAAGLPVSAQDSLDPADLWKAMADYEARTGGRILAIPHNGNGSNGLMFGGADFSGKPFDAAYAKTRARWEPLYEATQIKGDGETHPTLSPEDEFAVFERWDRYNLLASAPKQPGMIRNEYAREALKQGLAIESRVGANPYKFGMIGSSDSHIGITSVVEGDFYGKLPETEPRPDRAIGNMSVLPIKIWEMSASGLAAVWATDNTREALFDAMARREVYGTTGSRIMVRFFGGWDYAKDAVFRPDYVEIGYGKGVPMGGDLTRAPAGKAPVFMALALKDPDEANLDRVQIVKGWLDAKGETREKVYDVALSDGRKADPKTGKVPPVGSTVDVKNASYTNTIGAAELAAVWTDPDFDPSERAFYYVRVIEIPKPRWTAYDVKFFGTKMPPEVPMTVQDRAYTSPIWYTP